MRLSFSPADEAFRLEVRAFVREHLPASIRRKVEQGLRLEHEDYVTWFRILESRGSRQCRFQHNGCDTLERGVCPGFVYSGGSVFPQ